MKEIMHLEVTEDPGKRIEMAKAIVREKSNYYTDERLEAIRAVVREKTELVNPEDIDDELYKTIYYYWVYGCPASEYYCLDFSHKTHEEIKEYVTMREKVVYRNRLNRIEDAHLFNNKWDTYCYFKEYFNRDVMLLKNEDDYLPFCDFVQKHSEFVVKPLDMGGGDGVHKVTIDENSTEADRMKLFEELLSECEKNKALYHRGKEDAVIIEELINQIPEMAVMHPNSINGVRVTTVRINDKITIFYPWFKFGRSGNFLTSAIYGTLDACIDTQTGIVITPGCSESHERFDIHPDTGVPILGFKIPKWKELIDTVTELALKVDTINYVGWDMVLTEKGWVLMEGNFSGDFSWQFCLKRGTKKEFEALIGWHLTKEFWWQE